MSCVPRGYVYNRASIYHGPRYRNTPAHPGWRKVELCIVPSWKVDGMTHTSRIPARGDQSVTFDLLQKRMTRSLCRSCRCFRRGRSVSDSFARKGRELARSGFVIKVRKGFRSWWNPGVAGNLDSRLQVEHSGKKSCKFRFNQKNLQTIRRRSQKPLLLKIRKMKRRNIMPKNHGIRRSPKIQKIIGGFGRLETWIFDWQGGAVI